MRKEKLEELQSYIEKLKVKKCELLEGYGKFLTSKRYMIELNNGEKFIREKLVKNGEEGNACIILPITTENNVILVVQPRVFTKDTVAVELPAGYVDGLEDYEMAARRELLEETGYVAEEMIHLGSFYQDQGCSGAYNKAYLAINCTKDSSQNLDRDEFISYFECSYDEMLELVDRGMINDVQSQLVIERSKQYQRK